MADEAGIEGVERVVRDSVGDDVADRVFKEMGLDDLVGACRRNSFSADTLVLTDEGFHIISGLQIGDLVWALNEETGEFDFYPIIDTISHQDTVIVNLTLDGELLKTTAEHPFYTFERDWVVAGQLRVGERILQADGTYGVVEAVVFVVDPQPMYNLTVDQAHTFFVGEGAWLVHNAGGCINPKNAKVIGSSLGTINPKSVHFTQDSISGRFKNGSSVENTISGLKTGAISPDNFPPIRIFEIDGTLFSLDNRRLYVFQQAGIPIKTTPATKAEITRESFKFTTKNSGTTIRVRGG